MRSALLETVLWALLLALPVAAALGDLPTDGAAALVCPANHRIQLTSTTHNDQPREMNASTYCVDADTFDACVGTGSGPCRRSPTSAFVVYAAIFGFGWVLAFVPAGLITWLRRRRKR